jgi:hypothetical protein
MFYSYLTAVLSFTQSLSTIKKQFLIMKKLILATAVLLATGANVLARTPQFGVKLGGNLSTAITKPDVEWLKFNPGFQVGLTLDYELSPNVYLLSGLEVVQKGFKIELEGLTATSSPVYLQIPVLFGYKFDVGGKARLVPQAGPYLAYGLGGKITMKDSSGVNESEEYDYFGDDNNARKFDIGLTVGAGLELGRIGVNLGYSLGLLNISDAESDGNWSKNSNLFLSVGYKF